MHRVPRMEVSERTGNVGGKGEAETPGEGEGSLEDVLPEIAAGEELGDDEDARAGRCGFRIGGRGRGSAAEKGG